MNKRKQCSISMWAASAFALCATTLLASTSPGQDRTGKPEAVPPRSARNSISGSVTVDGQALPDIPVLVVSTQDSNSNRLAFGDRTRRVTTDQAGRFSLNNLKPGLYRLVPALAGYVAASGVLDEDGNRIYYSPGDSATLRMAKGGVITGKVVDADGTPVTKAPVRSIRLRDQYGHPTASLTPAPDFTPKEIRTDDRGVYRLYGLEPGVYLVSAGGGMSSFVGRQEAYDADAPTYYPGSPRGTASEITVGPGQEVEGIDITYQSFGGHSITGSATGAVPAGSLLNAAFVVLSEATTGTIQQLTVALELKGAKNFVFTGVPDGKYNILAVAGFGSKDMTLAPPRPINVNGSDSIGMKLTLIPVPQVMGSVAVEPPSPVDDPKAQCKSSKGLKACLISANLKGSNSAIALGLLASGLSFDQDAVPDDSGKFQILLLGGPGRYHLDITLADQELYVKSVTMPPDSPGRAPLDGAAGFLAVAGQKLNNLAVTLGEGAAGLSGRVAPKSASVELPARVSVTLVPAEPGSEGNVLRYAQTLMRADSTFQFRNIAPGQYYVVARGVSDDEMIKQFAEPLWSSAELRNKLHDQARKSGALVEFRQCQQTAGYAVQYAPPVAPKADTKRNSQ